MNLYTVTNCNGLPRLEIGIAVTFDGHNRFVRLGRWIDGVGSEADAMLDPNSPPSVVPVAGGIELMRTASLNKLSHGEKPRYMLSRCKPGLQPDLKDSGALVFIESFEDHSQYGYTPNHYTEIVAQGFRVTQVPSRYLIQALVKLKEGESANFHLMDKDRTFYTVFSEPGEKQRLKVMPHAQYGLLRMFKV